MEAADVGKGSFLLLVFKSGLGNWFDGHSRYFSKVAKELFEDIF